MLLAQLPTISNTGLVTVVLGASALLFIANQVVSLINGIRGNKEEVIPRSVLEKELSRLEAKIDSVQQERREVSHQLFTKIEDLGTSVSRALNDFSRAVGRLEGGQEIAEAIREAIKK